MLFAVAFSKYYRKSFITSLLVSLIMKEEDHISVLDGVFFPLRASFSPLSCAGPSLVADHVVEAHHLCSDKPLFEDGRSPLI